MRPNFAMIVGVVGLFAACAAVTDRDGDVASPPSETPQSTEPAQVATSADGVIPVGQQIDVRLRDRLSSETAQVEQEVVATTVVDLMQGDDVLVPAGSEVIGVVSSVQDAGRLNRAAHLGIHFENLEVDNRSHEISALPTQAFESGGVRAEAGRATAGGAVGAIVGGIIGGLEGAIIGAAVGAGGVIAATEGENVVLPAGSIVRIRMDRPVDIR